MSAPAGPYILSQRQRVEHAADCFWNRAHPPVDGDEAACCSCSAHAEAAVPLSRWAYATLEELPEIPCQKCGWCTGPGKRCGFPYVLSRLPESGGTIKLPDGSAIVVEATTWGDLILARKGDAVTTGEMSMCEARAAILAAWNAEYGIDIGEPCDHCEGGGEVWGEDEHGEPDDPDLSSPCSRCGGTGTAAQETGR